LESWKETDPVGGAVFPVSVTVEVSLYAPHAPVWLMLVVVATGGIVPVTVSANTLLELPE